MWAGHTALLEWGRMRSPGFALFAKPGMHGQTNVKGVLTTTWWAIGAT